MNIKWIFAIVIIFGLLTMCYVLRWPAVLKPLLILSCVILIGVILLQAGRGGGLAAIGGLADQTPFGTKTGGFLGKLTFLVGAVFLFTAILLTKLTLTSIHGTGTITKGTPVPIQHEAVDEHAGHDHEGHDHEGHGHSQETAGAAATEDTGAMGMKATGANNQTQSEEGSIPK